jgi:hypothetical protein
MDPYEQHQTLRQWRVGADQRIVGAVYNRPGQADGQTIMTSPVLEVRFMGARKTPVAFTESGNTYWLAEPSAGWGIDEAEAFVWRMSRRDLVPSDAKPDPLMRTVVLRVV